MHDETLILDIIKKYVDSINVSHDELDEKIDNIKFSDLSTLYPIIESLQYFDCASCDDEDKNNFISVVVGLSEEIIKVENNAFKYSDGGISMTNNVLNHVLRMTDPLEINKNYPYNLAFNCYSDKKMLEDLHYRLLKHLYKMNKYMIDVRSFRFLQSFLTQEEINYKKAKKELTDYINFIMMFNNMDAYSASLAVQTILLILDEILDEVNLSFLAPVLYRIFPFIHEYHHFLEKETFEQYLELFMLSAYELFSDEHALETLVLAYADKYSDDFRALYYKAYLHIHSEELYDLDLAKTYLQDARIKSEMDNEEFFDIFNLEDKILKGGGEA